MMDFDHIPKVYMAQGYTDLRKGIDGYSNIVQNTFKLNPYEDVLFIFCNKHRDKIKCLYWDKNGFWLLYKRLETGHFKWEKHPTEEALLITSQQLKWLMEGLKIKQKTAFKSEDYKYV